MMVLYSTCKKTHQVNTVIERPVFVNDCGTMMPHIAHVIVLHGAVNDDVR